MRYVPEAISQWAVIIEQAWDEPRVVIFDNEPEAAEYVEAKNALTSQVWADDPEWHNHAVGPIRVSHHASESLRIWREACEYQGV